MKDKFVDRLKKQVNGIKLGRSESTRNFKWYLGGVLRGIVFQLFIWFGILIACAFPIIGWFIIFPLVLISFPIFVVLTIIEILAHPFIEAGITKQQEVQLEHKMRMNKKIQDKIEREAQNEKI